MNFKKIKIFFASFITAITVLSGLTAINAQADTADLNRFNVMFVLDASGSMNETDPDGCRFEAINQFTNLLAEHGNYLGGIVFSTDISAEKEPTAIDSQQDKDQISQLLSSVPASGWTNSGDALLAAVELITESGDKNLPSVIVFLSDGNTEMGTEEETTASLANKAEAIQRARENSVSIYSVCLNADNTADTSEMLQISNATGGVFQEVGSANDLNDVFNTFYNLIYGTSTVILADETFPSSGIVEKSFEIPGIGVEEVNIIIYGKTANLALFKPDGSESHAEKKDFNSFTMVKVTDVEPGVWQVITTGVPGDRIKINMVYNTDLSVELELPSEPLVVNSNDDVALTAVLRSGSQLAADEKQYAGYSAELYVFDVYGERLDTIPMTLNGDHFEVKKRLPEGTYNFKAAVSGNYINKESETVGPLRVTAPEKIEEEVKKENTAPVAVEDTVEKTVYIFPFKDARLDIDLNSLATDKEDETLKYKIVSSSFIEDTDYSVSPEGLLSLYHFSLSKGAFTVRAIDTDGLSCDIEIVVVSHNVGVMALIGLGAIALVIAAIVGVSLYLALNKRFYGACYITQFDEEGNYYEEKKREKGRGRIKLSSFNVTLPGLNPSKCYFQATGKDYVYFVTDKKVYGSGRSDKKFRVDGNGYDMTVSADQFSRNGIRIKFVSRKIRNFF